MMSRTARVPTKLRVVSRSHRQDDEPSLAPEPSAPPVDEATLLAALRSSEPAAAAALYDRARPIVDQTIFRLMGARDTDHDDIAQMALIEIVSSIHRFRKECPLDAWISRVTAHVAYKHLRRRTTERRLFSAVEMGTLQFEGRSEVQDSSTRAVLRRVREHLDAIDPDKAWAFLLHDVCGYELREIAAITGASVSACQTRLVRGRRQIHARIDADPELADVMRHREEAGDGS